ncbi:DUF2809 domain-containing protein [Actinoplanes sp. NPDC049681]|uniref:DUF2809 domain-containing protein n=1 Tax=Actinoplanes sp. NPDC049681 TaxID=3363905 RepID=UPI00378747E6
MIRRRLFPLAGAVLIVGVAFLVRAVAGGPLEQYAGTALYASLVYAGVFVLRPGAHPITAGASAVLFCWLVEFFQLTGIPARFPAAHLILGARFDATDVVWYPVGVVPLVVAHLAVRARRGSGGGRGSPAARPPG